MNTFSGSVQTLLKLKPYDDHDGLVEFLPEYGGGGMPECISTYSPCGSIFNGLHSMYVNSNTLSVFNVYLTGDLYSNAISMHSARTCIIRTS